MLGKLFGRGEDRATGEPQPLAPRRGKHGIRTLRALGDPRVLAAVEAADAADWTGLKTALAHFDLGHDQAVLGELAVLDGIEEWILRAADEEADGPAVRKADGSAVGTAVGTADGTAVGTAVGTADGTAVGTAGHNTTGTAANNSPHRATALLISGARHVHWGWEARTSARAADVSREQWQTFYERLRIAEEHLLEAAELRPDWVTPWRHLLTSGRGMSVADSVKETRLAAGLRRDPLNVDLHLEWVYQLQPRWGGKPGEALDFARRAFAAAPDGHRLGCAVAMAWVEQWVESDDGDCLQDPRIRTELREAAERSILHHAYVRRPGWQGDYNMFAMALSLAGSSTASNVFRELDGVYTEWPWTFMADPEKTYARFRKSF